MAPKLCIHCRWFACHRFQRSQTHMTKLDQESKAVLPRVGWVLYDGGCGFCFRWVHFWEKVIERRGFSLKDLQSAWEDGSLKSSQDNLLDDILVLTRAGTLESGADAYLFVARGIWWPSPFSATFPLPGFHCTLSLPDPPFNPHPLLLPPPT